jgi:hypothetical protein
VCAESAAEQTILIRAQDPMQVTRFLAEAIPPFELSNFRVDARDVGNVAKVEFPGNISLAVWPYQNDLSIKTVIVLEPEGLRSTRIFHDFIDEMHVHIYALRSGYFFKNRPVFFVSIAKSGTHMMLRLLSLFGFNTSPLAPQFVRLSELVTYYEDHFGRERVMEPGRIHAISPSGFHSNLRHVIEPLAELGISDNQIFTHPVVFLYRHPLDILVSEAWHLRLVEKGPVSSCIDLMESTSGICHDLLSGRLGLTPFAQRLEGYLGWLRFMNAIPICYEELVGELGGGDRRLQAAAIWSLQLKLQVPGRTEDFCNNIFDTGSRTFRRGRVGSHIDELGSVRNLIDLQPDISRLLDEFGYSPGQTAPSRHSVRFRTRYSSGNANFAAIGSVGSTSLFSCRGVLVAIAAPFQSIDLDAIDLQKLPYFLSHHIGFRQTLAELYELVLAADWGCSPKSIRYIGGSPLFDFVEFDGELIGFITRQTDRGPAQWLKDRRFALITASSKGALQEHLTALLPLMVQDVPVLISLSEAENVVWFRDEVFVIPTALGPVNLTDDQISQETRITKFTYEEYVKVFGLPNLMPEHPHNLAI